MTKFSLFPFCDGTEISNMAAGGHSNMAAVGNNKIILSIPQNSLVIFAHFFQFKVFEKSLKIGEKSLLNSLNFFDF